MKLELFFRPHVYPGGDLRGIVDAARLADRLGYRTILFGEHIVIGRRTDRYPYGTFPDSGTPWLEPLTTLAALASATKKLRLATGVLLAPLRPAALLAKMVATVDVLSAGRVELGVGVGWQREEYEACGVDWHTRYQRLDSTVAACRQLWGEQPVTLEVDSVVVQGVRALPQPVQPRVPLYFGLAPTSGNADRIAVHGDGWAPAWITPAAVSSGVATIRDAFERVGRDPGELRVRVMVGAFDESGRMAVTETVAQGRRFIEAGATTVCTGPKQVVESPDELEHLLGELIGEARELGV